ncbi:MAG: twin-arginine translocation signal domain-containing protein [Firmicutes bacterium]|nr:twin-arginine translocation signal domain-containing protein [Bacillota bacterium]
MKLSRRTFLKLSGVTAATASLTTVGFKGVAEAAYLPVRINYAKEVNTICTFCGVGCGIICHVRDGKIINTEGDPDHPINEGTLCSKGSSIFNVSYIYDVKGEAKPNPNRLTKPLYRAPGEANWEEKSWEWMLKTIAERVKKTRDESFEQSAQVAGQNVTVNRTNAISWLGSAFCTNEENYLFQKMTRALGIINLDHCARL